MKTVFVSEVNLSAGSYRMKDQNNEGDTRPMRTFIFFSMDTVSLWQKNKLNVASLCLMIYD
ncbi:MAG: hypothetical protein E6H08_06885 [Bacteroidetes bacterium]|nr:MAG: hypothetical protein E6H08_06885 [Bacteroidota bacterium]